MQQIKTFAITILLCLFGDFSSADTLSGDPEREILTINLESETIVMTVADLLELPSTTFETTTIWTDGTQVFQGVSFTAVFEHLGLDPRDVQATAINDYSVTIPASDMVAPGATIAYLNNGKEMSRRGKGPLWVVYPYDSDPKFRKETIYGRSIWQLDHITIK